MASKNERVILDTNLWISFLISNDFSKLDKILFSQNTILVFSQELLDEFVSVAKRPKFKKYFSTDDIESVLELLDEFAEFVESKSRLNTFVV